MIKCCNEIDKRKHIQIVMLFQLDAFLFSLLCLNLFTHLAKFFIWLQEINAFSTWEESRPLFEESQEYRYICLTCSCFSFFSLFPYPSFFFYCYSSASPQPSSSPSPSFFFLRTFSSSSPFFFFFFLFDLNTILDSDLLGDGSYSAFLLNHKPCQSYIVGIHIIS